MPNTMNISAMASFNPKEELKPFNFQMEEPINNEVIIEIDNCGLCYSDIHMIDNDWRASTYPLVPGHEIIGKIIKTGEVATKYKLGEVVGVGWQKDSCLRCKLCSDGFENLCQSGNQGTIIGNHGGFATHIKLKDDFVFRIPEKLNSNTAAPLLCAGTTVYSGLISSGMQANQKIGIIGLGGLGHLATQYASKLGNQVTVFEKNDDKVDLAYDLGADDIVITNPDVP
ncbi:MAG: alcohol dehydrogenase catalytic domain-containing protein, partial [Candidatus Heimdallarchaeota archaeon]|nr:alcohol dehydrogenase catalytic domain-containing protein [Candidatus Heimdallarchaeota archaeon]